MVRPKTASKKRRGSFRQKSTSKRFRGGGVAMVPALLRSSPDGINFVDRINVSMACDTTGSVALLNGSVPGTGENQRLGRKVTMKSIQIRYSLFPVQSAAAAANNAIRMLLVYDRQSNGAAPAWADVIQSQDAASATSSTAWDMPNQSNRERFAIIRDWKWFIQEALASPNNFADVSRSGTDYQNPREGVVYVKLKGLETHFNTGTAGTVADMQTGSLHLMTLGTSAAANNTYDLVFHSRVFFTA